MVTIREYCDATKRVIELFKINPVKGSKEFEELHKLVGVMEKFEEAEYPIDDPTPEELAEFRADQELEEI